MISSAFGINKHEQIFLRLRKIAQALRASANLRVLYLFQVAREKSFDYLFAFSRTSRTHPNFVSAAGIEIFGLQIGRPTTFLQGLWASFLCPLGTKTRLGYVLAFFALFDVTVVFLELVFTPMAIDKKKCSPSADWTELF